jgi:diaminopimelate decarboxylase
VPGYPALAKRAAALGDTFYVYDEEKFARNFREFLAVFRTIYAPTTIAYSYKTNYLPAICKKAAALGAFAEIVSSMEYEIVKGLRLDGPRVIFNGPCKDSRTTEAVLVGGGIVNVDSGADLELILAIARKHPGRTLRVGVRCNLRGELPFSRFGIDVGGKEFAATIAALRARRNVQLAGLHCHYPSRDLESFRERAEALLRVCDTIWDEPPEFLNFGGGFAGKMPGSLKSQFDYAIPAYEDYAEAIAGPVAKRFGTGGKRPRLFVEPGTGIVADCMSLVTRITTVKLIRDKAVAVCGASVFNTSPTAKSIRLPITVVGRAKKSRARAGTDIVGYTCIESDYLARDLQQRVVAGDFVVIDNVGSYSIVMKPPFILPNVPVVRWTSSTRGYQILKRAERPRDLLQTFTGLVRAD